MSIFQRLKTEWINVHVSATEKKLLEDAARVRHKNASEFLLDAGIAAANKALEVQRRFVLNDEQLGVFKQALQGPEQKKPDSD